MTRVYLGLGANIGNREANLRAAVRGLPTVVTVVRVSSLYAAAAVVPEGEPAGPDFLNAACEIATELSPAELLRYVKEIEYAIGRRGSKRWAPRPIDIDILLFGDEVIDTPELVVPHPLLAEREFVLTPLAEIAPDVVHPVLRRSIAEFAAGVKGGGVERVAGPEWADDRM